MTNPKISVIIPVYNGKKTIWQTVQSVLSQSFLDFELIVVNSGSTDGTAKILETIEDRRIRVLQYAERANVAVNRNRGIKSARTGIVAFLDADDLWLSDKLKLQYEALQRDVTATVAYCWTDCVDEFYQSSHKGSHATWTGDVLKPLILDDFIGSGSNIMCYKQAILDVGLFDEVLTNTQDTDMWLKLASKYKFACIPSVQILYRVSPTSMSSNLKDVEACNLIVIDRSFDNNPSLSYLKPIRLANLYKYLCFKTLSLPPRNHQPLMTVKFLVKLLLADPSMLFKGAYIKGWLKFFEILIYKHSNLNTTTFLGYIKTYV